MSERRALVDCVVLSLHDACVFYPCCKSCFSKIDVEQQDTTRCRCSRCGYSCLKEQVDYRYRLSLKVARDRCIFGVTVFGTCLNPFFGIHATGLQRLVENFDGPVEASTRSTLLQRAVENCFIGRHFIFGIKLNETESGPWSRAPGANGSRSKETLHVIASQMILPKTTGLGGCTVVSYYRILLQKAAESELESSGPGKTSRPPTTTLLLLPHHSPARSINDVTLCASGFLSQSLLRSQNHDSTLTPTPPWQQSLGLVTSSAEQEEGCSSQDSADEHSQLADNFKTPHRTQRDSLDHKAAEDMLPSPLLSLECSHPSFAKYPHSPTENTSGKPPITPSPTSVGHSSCREKRCLSREPTKTFLSNSLAWEDLPFSESLAEFLCEENKDFHIVSETEPHLNVQNETETARNKLEIKTQDPNLSVSSTADSQSRIFLDITNTPSPSGGDGHDLSEQECKTPAGCVDRSQDRNICSNEKEEKASSLSFENEEVEQFEGDAYDCSADLFSSSLEIDMNTNTINTQAETVRTNTDACLVLSKSDKHHMRSEETDVPHSSPEEKERKGNKWNKRDSLLPPVTQDLDFIPPSQSTPIVKVAAVSRLHAHTYSNKTSQADTHDSSAFYRNLPEVVNKKAAKITPSLSISNFDKESTKENILWTTSSRQSPRFTPKRFWRSDKHKNRLVARQHRRGALTTGSTGGIKHECDSGDYDVTVCENEDSGAIIIPPTPAAETQQCVKLGGRRQTDDSSSLDCKRPLLDQTLTSSQTDETFDKKNLDSSNCRRLDDENEACDWSKDLFSDSLFND